MTYDDSLHYGEFRKDLRELEEKYGEAVFYHRDFSFLRVFESSMILTVVVSLFYLIILLFLNQFYSFFSYMYTAFVIIGTFVLVLFISCIVYFNNSLPRIIIFKTGIYDYYNGVFYEFEKIKKISFIFDFVKRVTSDVNDPDEEVEIVLKDNSKIVLDVLIDEYYLADKIILGLCPKINIVYEENDWGVTERGIYHLDYDKNLERKFI